MEEQMKTCPACESPYGYSVSDTDYLCPECNHQWNANTENTQTKTILDANGNELKDGDNVIVIKNLPVKGFLKPIKSGTKVKNIRLLDGDHNIDCKIDGFGAMQLKSEFVKKA